MSAFHDASEVEIEALQYLLPYMAEHCVNAQIILTHNQYFIQKFIGDFIAKSKRTGTVVTIELKAERTYTGNLFAETWSNKLENPGWLMTTQAKWLWYFFTENRWLFRVKVSEFREWAYGRPGERGGGELDKCREVPQSKYQQLNNTHGRLVPIEALRILPSFKGPLIIGGEVLEASLVRQSLSRGLYNGVLSSKEIQ